MSCLIWIGLAVLASFCAACSGCLLLLNFGTELIATDIETQLKKTPEVKKHFGEIESFQVDWSRSLTSETADMEASDVSTMVYDIKGSRGEGYVTVTYRLDEQSDAVIEEAEIQKAGETIRIQTGPQ